ncbi:MAG: Fur family transcriptional regulator [Acidiferrobacteraceae bacterium]
MNQVSDEDIHAVLNRGGITPTVQRVEIARVLLSRCAHLSADEIFVLVNDGKTQVSKATVYNTLGLFAEKGLVREVIVDPDKTVYDPNVVPHHHFYNVVTGQLVDINAAEMEVKGLPPIPEGTSIDGIEIIVRLRPNAA